MNFKIPKIIHYCWFGNNEFSPLTLKCMESWKKYCSDYEIVEWNETNYDVNKIPYISEAYKCKKFAFVTDYVRLDVLYTYGGIYLDTDVELIRPLDKLLENKAFIGMEAFDSISSGSGMGSVKNMEMFKYLRDVYLKEHFIVNGKENTMTCVDYNTIALIKKGFVKKNKMQQIEDMVIYPKEYLCPITLGHKTPRITSNTYSIHHFENSWYTGSKFKKIMKYKTIPLKKKIKYCINVLFGEGAYSKMKSFIQRK